MDLLSDTTTKNLLEEELPADNEQFFQFTHYTRTNKEGSGIRFMEYRMVSRGREDSQVWIKNYLSEDKENLYLQALRNLYRKLDFIELSQSLESEDISEEEFDKELKDHEDRYLIPSPSATPTVQQIIQITDILKRIGREKLISVDEASEVFSLNMDQAMTVLETQ